jgi:mono/diheme cytochrome c family protein
MKLSLVLLVGSLAACTADITTDSRNEDLGRETFDSIVKPLVTGCVGCHDGSLAPGPNLTSFTALHPRYTEPPGAENILVTKGDLGTPVGLHMMQPYLTEAEQAAIATWIDSL